MIKGNGACDIIIFWLPKIICQKRGKKEVKVQVDKLMIQLKNLEKPEQKKPNLVGQKKL